MRGGGGPEYIPQNKLENVDEHATELYDQASFSRAFTNRESQGITTEQLGNILNRVQQLLERHPGLRVEQIKLIVEMDLDDGSRGFTFQEVKLLGDYISAHESALKYLFLRSKAHDMNPDREARLNRDIQGTALKLLGLREAMELLTHQRDPRADQLSSPSSFIQSLRNLSPIHRESDQGTLQS